MSTKLGIVGLPNAGKSSLFNALTQAHAQVAPYPFTTTDRNVGVASVEDPRLKLLAGVVPHDKIIPTAIEFVDIAGLIKGAHKGEGLGNQFLSHIFGVDAILHVVRCFEDGNVPHPIGGVDPERDVEVINTELMLKDLEIIDRRLEKDRKLAKSGDKAASAMSERLTSWKQALEQGTPIRKLGLSPEDHPKASGIDLLSSKPVIYVANIDEVPGSPPPGYSTGGVPGTSSPVEALRKVAAQDQAHLVSLCVKLEAELSELEPADRAEMMRELGLKDSALPVVVQQGYALLQLVTFFTTASRMVQAWTVRQGTKAPQAAGVIHTDFEQKFIRAEVIAAQDLVRSGGEVHARTKGLLRTEGRDYEVHDGDVIHFRIG